MTTTPQPNTYHTSSFPTLARHSKNASPLMMQNNTPKKPRNVQLAKSRTTPTLYKTMFVTSETKSLSAASLQHTPHKLKLRDFTNNSSPLCKSIISWSYHYVNSPLLAPPCPLMNPLTHPSCVLLKQPSSKNCKYHFLPNVPNYIKYFIYSNPAKMDTQHSIVSRRTTTATFTS